MDGVRRALKGYSRDGATFEFEGYLLLATGGSSVGSVPTELYNAISRLHAVGALEAAGFVAVEVDAPGEGAPVAADDSDEREGGPTNTDGGLGSTPA